MTSPEAAVYSPDALRFWHSGRCARGCRWAMLESAVEGGAGQPGNSSRGAGSRQNYVDFKSDLELAADQLPIYWQATRIVFSKQHRYSVWLDRWHLAGDPTTGTDQEPLERSAAVDLAIWRMATVLGWTEDLTTAA